MQLTNLNLSQANKNRLLKSIKKSEKKTQNSTTALVTSALNLNQFEMKFQTPTTEETTTSCPNKCHQLLRDKEVLKTNPSPRPWSISIRKSQTYRKTCHKTLNLMFWETQLCKMLWFPLKTMTQIDTDFTKWSKHWTHPKKVSPKNRNPTSTSLRSQNHDQEVRAAKVANRLWQQAKAPSLLKDKITFCGTNCNRFRASRHSSNNFCKASTRNNFWKCRIK